MEWRYDYRDIQVAPRSWRRILQAHGAVVAAIEEQGGVALGLFGPQIGMASDAGILISAWPIDGKCLAAEALEILDDVLNSDGQPMTATARPAEPSQLPSGGVYAHRRFTIDANREDEFVELSDTAWLSFEATFDVRGAGLWRIEGDGQSGAEEAEMLLLTRYADLATWEASRRAGEQTRSRDAAERFTRRRDLTIRSTVVTTELLGGETAPLLGSVQT